MGKGWYYLGDAATKFAGGLIAGVGIAISVTKQIGATPWMFIGTSILLFLGGYFLMDKNKP